MCMCVKIAAIVRVLPGGRAFHAAGSRCSRRSWFMRSLAAKIRTAARPSWVRLSRGRVLTASCPSTLWYVGARQENRSQIKYKCSRFLQLDIQQQMPQSLIAGNYHPSVHNQEELKKQDRRIRFSPGFLSDRFPPKATCLRSSPSPIAGRKSSCSRSRNKVVHKVRKSGS